MPAIVIVTAVVAPSVIVGAMVALIGPALPLALMTALLTGIVALLHRQALPYLLLMVALVSIGIGSLDLGSFGLRLPGVNSNAGLLALAGAGGVLALRALMPRPQRTAVVPAFLLFAVVVYFMAHLIGLGLTRDLDFARKQLQFLATAGLFGVLGYTAAQYEGVRRSFPVAMALLGIVSGAIGVVEFLAPDGFYSALDGRIEAFALDDWHSEWQYASMQGGSRLHGVWPWSAYLGYILALCIPFGLHVLQRSVGVRRLLWGVGWLLPLFTLLGTGHRMSLLATVVGVLVAIAVVRGMRRVVLASGVLLLGVLVVLVAVPAEAQPAVLVRTLDLLDLGSAESSADTRLYFYRQILDHWTTSPITGYGLGASNAFISTIDRYQSSPHSFWVQLLGDMGVLGFGGAALVVAALARLYWQLRASGQYADAMIAATVAAGMISLTDHVFTVPQALALFALIQGIAAAHVVRAGPDRGAGAGVRGHQQGVGCDRALLKKNVCATTISTDA